jgi:phosphate:Na+ symporter
MDSAITHFLGGIGLFLLGMWLMTDGLKLAAGPALERILREWTRTRLRGLFSGVLVTGVVQSSTAVTVATIGFVNAGLLSLGQSMWVIFGSNVGTTMTGWLVALIGFKFKVELFALPMIGVGMLLRLTGENTRRGAIGLALAGFGTLFLGIDVLSNGFLGLQSNVDLQDMVMAGPAGVVVPVLAGFVLTLLMQSSSAAMAIVLTATAAGIPLATAAAAVIGVNVGTTATAIIAAVGATPAARRTAAAHVLFNLLTGIVALFMLAPLLLLVSTLTDVMELPPTPSVLLAAFHTVFNVMGILLMWPLSARLERFLQQAFRTQEEDEGRLHHLDANVLGVPALAVQALAMEVARVGNFSRRMLAASLADSAEPDALQRDMAIVQRLVNAIGAFVPQIHRLAMGSASSERIPQILRLLRHHETLARLALVVHANRLQAHEALMLRERLTGFSHAVAATLTSGAPLPAEAEHEALMLAEKLEQRRHEYAVLKSDILAAGASGELSVAQMDRMLEQARAVRQVAEQLAEAASVRLALLAIGTPEAEAGAAAA